jgi:hypothetical protein
MKQGDELFILVPAKERNGTLFIPTTHFNNRQQLLGNEGTPDN